MKLQMMSLVMLLAVSLTVDAKSTKAVDSLVLEYAQAGQINSSAAQGKELWFKKFKHSGEFSTRSCTACHTNDLRKEGEHVKTGKLIKPMSVAVNAKRLKKVRKIKKWLKRNCKWTLGRECSAQEKTSILLYLTQ